MYKKYFNRIVLFVFLVLLSINSYSASGNKFKFAFFTDLHISTTNMDASEDLRKSVEDVNLSNDIDFVLVSGDITHNGDYNSLIKAKSILQHLKVPFYIVAGNHDFRWTTSGPTNFNNVFGDNKFSFIHKGFKFIGFTTTPIVNVGSAFIMNQDVIWMKKELTKKGKKMPVFVITHYPLLKGDVENWFVMTDLLRKYNVQSVFSGHYHRNAFLNYDDIPGVVFRSTLRAKEVVGGYSIVSITDSITISEKVVQQPSQEWLKFGIEKKKYGKADYTNRPVEIKIKD